MESYRNMNSSNGRYRQGPSNQNCRPCERQAYGQQPSNCGRRMMQDNYGRTMEVECVCKVNPKNGCHKNDPMEKLGPQFPVVMAYVPWQQWGELYEADCGLMQGTIFKDLNFIFCGVRC
ncbi:MAG: spore coat associated protein CotJA [Lachnospiraceae bacterium]